MLGGMTARRQTRSMFLEMMSPEEREGLERVRGAIAEDPGCLEKEKEEAEECQQKGK